ncbi:cholecystokinin A receptor [Mytilus galloprovincialis]|uniref:Cholecystokinin A receptor n=1 Tax=Mytilus galloprovincialis TaxID=29158 RepID=A0A8B6EFW0_MYTGA|nr:cholecystokinin A receptor [Mytilus galloprovincialis]
MNYSEEDRLTTWNLVKARKYILHDVFLVLYFILGLVGNLTVLIVYKLRLKQTEGKYFIPILAFVDMFVCILKAPLNLWINLLPVKFTYIISCQIMMFLFNMFGFSSILLLSVITLQRYLKVCRPFGPQLALKTRRISLLVIFVLSLTVSAPFIIIREQLPIPNIALNVTGYMCGINIMKVDQNAYRTFIFYRSFIIVGVMLELIILNLLIGRQMIIASKMFTVVNNVLRMKTTNEQMSASRNSLKTSFTNIHSVSMSLAETDLEKNSNGTNNENRSTNCDVTEQRTNTSIPEERISAAKRFSLMIIVINVVFILCYIPQLALLLSLFFNRNFWIKRTEDELIIIAFIEQMMIINNIVNPFVYGMFDRKFRAEAKTLMCTCCKYKNK